MSVPSTVVQCIICPTLKVIENDYVLSLKYLNGLISIWVEEVAPEKNNNLERTKLPRNIVLQSERWKESGHMKSGQEQSKPCGQRLWCMKEAVRCKELEES